MSSQSQQWEASGAGEEEEEGDGRLPSETPRKRTRTFKRTQEGTFAKRFFFKLGLGGEGNTGKVAALGVACAHFFHEREA